MTLAFIMLFIGSFFAKESLPATGWSPFMVAILFVAGLSNMIMIFLTNYGFEKVSTITASNILTMEMFFAVIFGFLFFREIPGIRETIGGIVILFSVIQMNKLE